MHFSLLVLVLATLLALPVAAQQPLELELVGEVQFGVDPRYNTGGSDVWGYTAPDGSEYAIMGILNGVAIVAVPSLDIVDIIPGPKEDDPYYHRDMVVHGDMLYVVAENTGTNEGLQIIDLGGLPESARLVTTYATDAHVRSHNLDVDAVTGMLYVLAQDYTGVRIVDASDPERPRDVGFVPAPDLHDIHARGDTLWVAEGRSPTFAIWDVADPQNPRQIVQMQVPKSGYVHNIWPTDDGRHVVTTEETLDKTVKVWDVSDPEDVELVGEYLGANRLAHNAHVRGDLVFLSHYAAGVTVIDISDPTAPVEVARYDTYPASDSSNFVGTWGAFPYTAGGYLYASDLEGKLTVLRVKHTTSSALPPERSEPLQERQGTPK
jgi:choice-of-anchor B domain-containing protein